MTEKPDTLGLIGCGRWGRHILRDLKALQCKVIVLAQSEQTKQSALAGQADSVVSNYAELFAHQCDGFIVATPTNSHLQVIQALLAAGKPIFTEKPLCNDLDDARKLLSDVSVPIYVMDKWKYHNGIIKLAELINSGKYGKIKQLILKRTQWGSPHQDVDPVWILLPHDISIAQFLLGQTPKALFATGRRIQENSLNSLYAILAANDCKVIIEVSGDAVTVERSVSVVCEHASFYLASAFTGQIQMQQHGVQLFGDEPVNIPFDNNMPLYAELERFVQFLDDPSVELHSSLTEGFETVQLISQLRNMVSD